MYLGIDLGTSNSAIASIIDGQARIFRPADGGEVLPSVIYFDKRGHRLYGRRAHDQAFAEADDDQAVDRAANRLDRLIGHALSGVSKGPSAADAQGEDDFFAVAQQEEQYQQHEGDQQQAMQHTADDAFTRA